MRCMRSASLAGMAAVGLWAMPAAAQQYPQLFERIQIEQVVGGVGGNTAAQAIQLRLRHDGDNNISYGRLWAYDANGNNPILLVDFAKNVNNGLLGDRVLVGTSAIKSLTNPPAALDFTLSSPIPPSYLAAGRLTYECDCGIIYWSLASGGYVGSHYAAALNDDDGYFGPSFPGAFPSSGVRGLLFQGGAADLSHANETDYALTDGPAVLTNNARKSFTVAMPPSPPSGLAGVELVKGVARLTWTDNSNDETAFRIQRQVLVGNVWTGQTIVATTPANTTSFMDSPGPGVYRYSVQSLNGSVGSAYTPWVRVAPAPPTGFKAQRVSGLARLDWGDGSEFETWFEVQRSQKVGTWSAPSTVATMGADSTRYFDNPGPGTFRYRVRSGSGAGVSAWTDWVSIP